MRATTKATVRKAKALRRIMTLPEILLWRHLRSAPVKVRRQHPLGPYVLDFYCPTAQLAIEIDGMAHDMGDRPERDMERDRFIRSRGIKIMRIPAKDVLAAAEQVAESIVAAALG